MNPVFAREAQEAVSKMTSRERRAMQEGGKKIYLGHERREGWSGGHPFYLFWCDNCRNFAKSYPNGFIGKQRLICPSCDTPRDITPWWAGPVLLWQEIRNLGTKPSIKE